MRCLLHRFRLAGGGGGARLDASGGRRHLLDTRLFGGHFSVGNGELVG